MGGKARKHTHSSEVGCTCKSGDKDSGIEVDTKLRYFKNTIPTCQIKEKHKIILVPTKIVCSGFRSNHEVNFFILNALLCLEIFALKANYFPLLLFFLSFSVSFHISSYILWYLVCLFL